MMKTASCASPHLALSFMLRFVSQSPAILCAYLLAASLPGVPHVCDFIAPLHPRFPQVAGGDMINAPTLTSEKYTLVSSTRRCHGILLISRHELLSFWEKRLVKKERSVGFSRWLLTSISVNDPMIGPRTNYNTIAGTRLMCAEGG